MRSPSLLPSFPFLLLHPLLQVPRSDPHSSLPEVITEQGPTVTVTTRPPGEQGCTAPGSAGVWRGLVVVLRAMRACVRGPSVCKPKARGRKSKGLLAGEALPQRSGSLEPLHRLTLRAEVGEAGPGGKGWVGRGRGRTRWAVVLRFET